MASFIPEAIHTAQKIVMGSQGDKIADLQKDTIEPSAKTNLTSDYGVKQSNTDHWLSVSSEEHQGPALLEDPFGREKVSSAFFFILILISKDTNPSSDSPL